MGPNLGADVECALKYLINHPLRIIRILKLQNVFKLILHLSNEKKDKIGVTYIGLKGIKSNIKPAQAVIATYESKPNVADHKVPEGEQNIQRLG